VSSSNKVKLHIWDSVVQRSLCGQLTTHTPFRKVGGSIIWKERYDQHCKVCYSHWGSVWKEGYSVAVRT
jgi:hypothetical protein